MKKIFVAVDNSALSELAVQKSVALASEYNAEIVGCHAYAAKLHDDRFRAMESGLPEEYRQEEVLEKQRDIHDSLITRGLELISDSYLANLQTACEEANVACSGLNLEGKNYAVLSGALKEGDYDLAVFGASGTGRVSRTRLGSVTERVARRAANTDLWIVKNEGGSAEAKNDLIIACVDGSPHAYGGLRTAMELGKRFNKRVLALATFDPYFHYGVFDRMKTALSEDAREVFNFEQQEKLHENIIDKGLAKIYRAHLEVAQKMAADYSFELETRLVAGKAWEAVLEFADKRKPWLLVLGRLGAHKDAELDIGGNAEVILREAQCDLYLSATCFTPPAEYYFEANVTWSKEAERRIGKIPAFARKMAEKAIEREAIEQGFTVVTSAVVDEVMHALMPPSALAMMNKKNK